MGRGENIVWRIELSWLAEQMGLLPCLTVCECSVGPLDISIAPGFVGKCDRMMLIEPVPRFAMEAERLLGTKVLKVAIGMEIGKAEMVDNGGSSFIKGTWAPTASDNQAFPVDVVTFDLIDDGQIEVMNLDCEGQEWAVLSHMRSEPKLLAVENCDDGPHYKEICDWLKEHGYIMRFMTGPWAETQIYTKET